MGHSRDALAAPRMSSFDRLCCKTIFGLGANNIFLDWVHTDNFDSKIQPIGFYYCPFPSVVPERTPEYKLS